MSAVLIVKAGPLAGKRFELEKEVVVGREEADVTLEDGEVSRRHAVIRPIDGGLEIDDLGSRNGTWVNDVRIQAAARLASGDVVRVGTTSLEIEVEVPRAAETAASTPALVTPPPAPPAAAPPAAPPPAAAPPGARGEVPSVPFGSLAAMSTRRGRPKVASRQVAPTLFSLAAIVGTAAALAVYFAER